MAEAIRYLGERMDPQATAEPSLTEVAQSSLTAFDSIAGAAQDEFDSNHRVNVDSRNTFTEREAAQSVSSHNQARRETLSTLTTQPAIARVKARKDDGSIVTLFITRASPPSTKLADATIASYGAPIGAIAERHAGEEFTLVVGWRSDLGQRHPNTGEVFEVTPGPRPSFETPADLWLVQPYGRKPGIKAPSSSVQAAFAMPDPAERAAFALVTVPVQTAVHRLNAEFATRLSLKAQTALRAGNVDTLAHATHTPKAQAQRILTTHQTVSDIAARLAALKRSRPLKRDPGFSR